MAPHDDCHPIAQRHEPGPDDAFGSRCLTRRQRQRSHRRTETAAIRVRAHALPAGSCRSTSPTDGSPLAGSFLWVAVKRERYFVSVPTCGAKELEGETKYRPRSDNIADYEGPIWRFVEERVTEAYRAGTSTVDARNGWYSGALLLETVPSVIYILMKHGDDLEEAIVRAVNDTQDNDTIAAIVGAAVGALHGRKKIPERWIENLSGRTTDRDDGRIFQAKAICSSFGLRNFTSSSASGGE